jgi:F-type H+-transporting ATPase subunit epsilon
MPQAYMTLKVLVVEVEGKEEAYIAVDEGVLVKTGAEVRISVRNAMSGMGLNELRIAVEEEFLQLDEQQQKLRSALTKMESGFVQRLVAFKQDASLS